MTKVMLDGDGTLQQQICRELRASITTGNLAANSRLAPSRVFAEDHGISRNTVIAAFDQLCAEGYLVTRQGAGTFVADIDSINDRAIPKAPRQKQEAQQLELKPEWSAAAKRVITKVPEHLLLRQPRKKLRYNFLYGEPGYADLPLEKWSRIIGRCARELTEKQLDYGPTAGLLELREALAGYLGRARGVNCDASQIFITQGTQDAIDLNVKAFVDEGDSAVVEEPHYRGFRRCLMAQGAKIHAVQVDEFGLDTKRLNKVVGAKLALVTPSHQFPFGSVMSLSRRRQLLEWASKHRTVVFEDDYDGEFRYEGKPIPSLQSLDKSGLVIYVGTASKMLFPSLRLGWMVVPKHLVAAFERLRSLTDSSGTILEQLAFAEFIERGHLERHIHKARRAHQQRREMLLRTLEEELAGKVQVIGTQAGIHVLVRFLDLHSDRTSELVELAARHEVAVFSAENYYSQTPEQVELLIGYAAMSPQQIRAGIKRLASVAGKLS